MRVLTFIYFSILIVSDCAAWGFFGHKKINEIAVYTLPPEMIGFYKKHMHLIVERSVMPDKRRFIDPSEGARHYIDIDHYGDSAIFNMPAKWYDAVEIYTEDTLKAYGVIPWHLLLLKTQLTRAFEEQDFDAIIRISADMGHYCGDANVPLHTTENYNGQMTGQYGIHGFWESRLPELFFESYNLFTGQAEYLFNPRDRIWQHIRNAHMAVDSVLKFEAMLHENTPENRKYAYEKKGKATVRVYSRDYSRAYHEMLDGMVERQMKRAIRLLGAMWFSSWVDAGQPSLSLIEEQSLVPEPAENTPGDFPAREHE